MQNVTLPLLKDILQRILAHLLTWLDLNVVQTSGKENRWLCELSLSTECPKKIVPFSIILLFGGRHLENFVPMGTAGISIKTRNI